MKNQIFMISADELDVLAEKITKKINLQTNQETISNTKDKDFITLDELVNYLHIPKQTIYGYVSKNTIPYYKPGKKLLFSLDEIYEWLENGKKPVKQKNTDQLNQMLTRKRNFK